MEEIEQRLRGMMWEYRSSLNSKQHLVLSRAAGRKQYSLISFDEATVRSPERQALKPLYDILQQYLDETAVKIIMRKCTSK